MHCSKECNFIKIPYSLIEAKNQFSKYNSELERCESCLHVRVTNPPNDEMIDYYYKSIYWNYEKAIKEAENCFEVNSKYHEKANFLLNLAEKNKIKNIKFCDFGCGYGGVINFIKDKCAISLGIEPSENLESIHKRFLPDKKIYKSIKDAKSNYSNINLLYISHVLEHLSDYEQTLKSLSNWLEHEGLLVIEVPNANYIGNILRGFNDFTWMQFPEHFNYFSPYSLGNLISKLGLEIIDITCEERDEQINLSTAVAKKSLEVPNEISKDRGKFIKWQIQNLAGMSLQIIAKKNKQKSNNDKILKNISNIQKNIFEYKCILPEPLNAINSSKDLFLSYLEINNEVSNLLNPLSLTQMSGDFVKKNRNMYFIPEGKSLKIILDYPGRGYLNISIILNGPSINDLYNLEINSNNIKFSDNFRGQEQIIINKYFQNSISISIKTLNSKWPSYYLNLSCDELFKSNQ